LVQKRNNWPVAQIRALRGALRDGFIPATALV
jgi:hypothetical protein